MSSIVFVISSYFLIAFITTNGYEQKAKRNAVFRFDGGPVVSKMIIFPRPVGLDAFQNLQPDSIFSMLSRLCKIVLQDQMNTFGENQSVGRFLTRLISDGGICGTNEQQFEYKDLEQQYGAEEAGQRIFDVASGVMTIHEKYDDSSSSSSSSSSSDSDSNEPGLIKDYIDALVSTTADEPITTTQEPSTTARTPEQILDEFKEIFDNMVNKSFEVKENGELGPKTTTMAAPTEIITDDQTSGANRFYCSFWAIFLVMGIAFVLIGH
jgi:hypothetical protein